MSPVKAVVHSLFPQKSKQAPPEPEYISIPERKMVLTEAPQLSKGELGIADRLNWEMDWNKPSSYTPTEYVSPWKREGWGSGDVIVTPPLKIDAAQEQFDERPILPQKPGFRQGQKDYEYMATEKEQRRERRAQAKDLAEARGRSWRDTPLPMPIKEEKEIKYPRWQDQEVVIQPVPGPRDPGEKDEVRILPVPIERTREVDYKYPDREEEEVRFLPVPIERTREVDYKYPNRRERREPRYRDRRLSRNAERRAMRSGRGVDTSATRDVNRPVMRDSRSYSGRLKENYNPYATERKDYSLAPRYGTGSLISDHATLDGYRKDLQYASSVGQGIGESSRIPKWDDILGVNYGEYGVPNRVGEVPGDYTRW